MSNKEVVDFVRQKIFEQMKPAEVRFLSPCSQNKARVWVRTTFMAGSVHHLPFMAGSVHHLPFMAGSVHHLPFMAGSVHHLPFMAGSVHHLPFMAGSVHHLPFMAGSVHHLPFMAGSVHHLHLFSQICESPPTSPGRIEGVPGRVVQHVRLQET